MLQVSELSSLGAQVLSAATSSLSGNPLAGTAVTGITDLTQTPALQALLSSAQGLPSSLSAFQPVQALVFFLPLLSLRPACGLPSFCIQSCLTACIYPASHIKMGMHMEIDSGAWCALHR
jgi:hypothetical protein